MKWGLERGDSIRETGARHRSTYEYKRELVNDVNQLESRKVSLAADIKQEERKLKSLATMMANLQERRASIQREIDEIAMCCDFYCCPIENFDAKPPFWKKVFTLHKSHITR